MSASRHRSIAAVAAIASLALTTAPAAASSLPLRLVSADANEQADVATQPALSADGRFLAFQGSLGGLRGVFRKDLANGDVTLVAGGSAYVNGTPAADASAPSISADGRYVSFTTRTPLDPAADPDASGQSVYVRDMTLAPSATGAYELASSRDGAPHALPAAVASGRVALSADGRRVVFVTTAASDLAAAPGDLSTPAGQVAARDLDADRTTLVSVVRDPATGVPFDPPQPVPGGAVALDQQGAALSADGTTVAWLGTDIAAQVPLLADEADAITDADAGPASQRYAEPLWRRIADGPSAPTRRIVGGGDPLAPGCPPGGTLQDTACQGPFPDLAGHVYVRNSNIGWMGLPGNGVPRLSADGRAVALIGDPNGIANVFLVDMHDGLTRRQALRPLTREVPLLSPERATELANIPLAGDIRDVGISADGLRVAFATARSEFPLAPPSLVGAPLAQLGLVELYRADLNAGTLERVSVPPGDGPSLALGVNALSGLGASAPSFGADGHMLAFASPASNLVAGDANGADDAFVATDDVTTNAPADGSISPPPAPLKIRPRWRIAVSARSRRDGSVLVTVAVPGGGRLSARAKALVRTRAHGRAARRRAKARAATRTVARRDGRARGDGLVTLPLRLARPYAALAHRHGGLEGTVAVTFRGPGGTPLHDELDVRFRARAARRKAVR